MANSYGVQFFSLRAIVSEVVPITFAGWLYATLQIYQSGKKRYEELCSHIVLLFLPCYVELLDFFWVKVVDDTVNGKTLRNNKFLREWFVI